ncbi:hypothetical protein Lal_00037625 [Lupinus albus]|nr:hypothetical protein Lal_00037625 [Lupinus albus]
MENHVISKITNIDDIVLLIDMRVKFILEEMRHVLDMCLNLISMGKLDHAGFVSHFGAGKWKLAKGNLVIARGLNEESLYIMLGGICSEEAKVAIDFKDLWHRRLGHMSDEALQKLTKDHLLDIKVNF